MLSDEEKAVLKTAKENYGLTSVEQGILVNLIEKQSKIIQAIATNLVEHIGTCPIDYDDDFENEKCERCQNTYAECWIEYFSKKVGE